MGLVTGILDVFAHFILQLQGWTTFDAISRCHALIRRARNQLSTFKHHSGHCLRTQGRTMALFTLACRLTGPLYRIMEDMTCSL